MSPIKNNFKLLLGSSSFIATLFLCQYLIETHDGVLCFSAYLVFAVEGLCFYIRLQSNSCIEIFTSYRFMDLSLITNNTVFQIQYFKAVQKSYVRITSSLDPRY